MKVDTILGIIHYAGFKIFIAGIFGLLIKKLILFTSIFWQTRWVRLAPCTRIVSEAIQYTNDILKKRRSNDSPATKSDTIVIRSIQGCTMALLLFTLKAIAVFQNWWIRYIMRFSTMSSRRQTGITSTMISTLPGRVTGIIRLRPSAGHVQPDIVICTSDT